MKKIAEFNIQNSIKKLRCVEKKNYTTFVKEWMYNDIKVYMKKMPRNMHYKSKVLHTVQYINCDSICIFKLKYRGLSTHFSHPKRERG